MTTDILAVLAAFASEFSRPTWKNIQIILMGAILPWSVSHQPENQLDLDKCSEEKINSLSYQLTLAA